MVARSIPVYIPNCKEYLSLLSYCQLELKIGGLRVSEVTYVHTPNYPRNLVGGGRAKLPILDHTTSDDDYAQMPRLNARLRFIDEVVRVTIDQIGWQQFFSLPCCY